MFALDQFVAKRLLPFPLLTVVPTLQECVSQAAESVSSRPGLAGHWMVGGRAKPGYFSCPAPQIWSASLAAALTSPRIQPPWDIYIYICHRQFKFLLEDPSPGPCNPYSLPLSFQPCQHWWLSTLGYITVLCLAPPALPSHVLPTACIHQFPQFKKDRVISFFLFSWLAPGWSRRQWLCLCSPKANCAEKHCWLSLSGFKDDILSWLCWKKL